MSEELKTINEKMDVVLGGIKNAQDVSDRNEKRIDALDKEQLSKITEDVSKTLEEVNNIKAKQDVVEKEIKNLESIANRPNVKKGEVEDAELKSNFLTYLRSGSQQSETQLLNIANETSKAFLMGGTKDQHDRLAKELTVGNNPQGGYWVIPEFANFIIKRVFETSPMRNIAKVESISTESLEIPIDDQEADAGWVGEIDARPVTSTPNVGKLVIHAHEIYAQPRATQKMLDDAGFDIQSWLQDKVSRRFSRLENTAFVNGDGSKEPKGFLQYSAWTTAGTYERGKIEQITSTVSASMAGDDVIGLQNAVIEDYQTDATWVMKRQTFGVVMTLKDSQGRYLLNPNIISQGASQILLGKPVVFFNDMPTLASNSLSVAYGDFMEGYTVVDRIGIRVLFDMVTTKPYIKYYTTKRVGGDVTNYESIKILKSKA